MRIPERRELIGSWMSDDSASHSNEPTKLDFTEDGQLRYTIIEQHKDQIILPTYRPENNELIADQPSSPREERTKADLTAQDELVLTYGGFSTIYQRYIN